MTHASLQAQFASIGAPSIMDKHVDPRTVARRINLLELDSTLRKSGWMLERDSQQFIRIVPLRERVAPKMRVITKSDHAAQWGSRPGRWA